jgi:hypothetical protein
VSPSLSARRKGTLRRLNDAELGAAPLAVVSPSPQTTFDVRQARLAP